MSDRETEVRCPICHRLYGHELIEDHIAAHSLADPDPLWPMFVVLLIVILAWVGMLVWLAR